MSYIRLFDLINLFGFQKPAIQKNDATRPFLIQKKSMGSNKHSIERNFS